MSGLVQHCGTGLRRQRVAASNVLIGGLEINGIDFVEVIDIGAPSEDLRQRILEVNFLKPDGVSDAGAPLLAPENFAIEGGSRVTGIKVVSVELGASATQLRLTLDRRGDFSPYVLRLKATAAVDTPPANMDPRLAEVTIFFKVECPSDFDCVEEVDTGRAREEGPPLDYLTRDYEGFRRLMLDRMAVTVPDWRERNPADLGVMLVEALADAADRASWFQDAVGTEAYLRTARQRQSLRRHGRLLGYQPDEGSNARVAVAILAKSDHLSGDPAIPKGARFLTAPASGAPGLAAALPREPEAMEALVNGGAIVFEAMQDLPTIKVVRNRMLLHDWGDEACCLPVGATEAWLREDNPKLDLAVGDLILFEELIPFGGAPGDFSDRAHRQLVRLSEVEPGVKDAVLNLDLVRIAWHRADALAFPLNLQGDAANPGTIAIGNIVLADEGRTLDFTQPATAVPEDAITLATSGVGGVLPDDGAGTVMRRRIASESLVRSRGFDPGIAATLPAATALEPTGEAVAEVQLLGGGQLWESRPDLLSSDRFAANFVIEPREGGGAYARFGDNVIGREPAADTQFKARLRVGGGSRGNIGAEAIRHVVLADPSKIAAVRNPLPAQGGNDPEAKEAIRIAAPHAFRRQRRAVTAQDYALAAAEHPDVVRAYARRRWTGSWYTMTLAVDLVGGISIDSAFADSLKRFLEERRLASHDLRIINPGFVSLDIALFACVKPEFYAPDVQRALLRVFSARALGNGELGYFHPDRLDFGEDIALSPIIARAMQVEGVQWIGMADHQGNRVGRFRRMDQPDFDHDDGGAIPVFDGEIARLDNDPNYPDHGVLRFHVDGGR